MLNTIKESGRKCNAIGEIPISPFGLIENNDQYHELLDIVEEIMYSGRELSEDEERSYDLILHLIDVYEDEKFPIPDATPLEVLHHLMEQNNVRQADLVGVVARSRGVISEICNGKRAITIKHAKALGNFFSVNPSVFV